MWDDLVKPLALFTLKLGPETAEGDPIVEEVETQRKAQEAEDRRVLVAAVRYKEKELGLASKPCV